MRLIDADELFTTPYPRSRGNGKPLTSMWAYITDQITHAPTIDAVPVVRCADCYYSDEAKVNEKGFLICPASGMEITDDDFCSYGERRSDD